MSRPRDSQISKLFGAQAKVSANMRPTAPAVMQTRADRLLASDWFRDAARAAGRTGTQPQRVAITVRGSGYCMPHKRGIELDVTLGRSNTTLLDLAHVLAHWITPDDAARHGVDYAKNLLSVLQSLAGKTQRDALRDEFRVAKVKYSTWSPEAKERARQRAIDKGTPFTRRATEEQQQSIIDIMIELSRPNRTGGHNVSD